MYSLIFYIIISISFSQIIPTEGLKNNVPSVWALQCGKVHLDPEHSIDNAIIIIRDGKIIDVGTKIKIPKEATIIDYSNKIAYPGFIESWYKYSPKIKNKYKQIDAHWNNKVISRKYIIENIKFDQAIFKSYRELGFTTVHVVPDSGVFQGYTSLIQLTDGNNILKKEIAQNIAYEVDGWGSNEYPNALLGVVALIRQTLIDASWYLDAIKKINKYPQHNISFKKTINLQVIGN